MIILESPKDVPKYCKYYTESIMTLKNTHLPDLTMFTYQLPNEY